MSAFADDFDYSKYDPDKLEKDLESGGLIPPGFYRAKLDGATTTTSKESQRAGWQLTYKIVGGDHDGATVEDTLWDGDKPASINRVLLFKHRLGVIRRNAETGKFEKVPDVHDFRDCLDREVIIHVKHEEYERKKDGGKGIALRLEFNGIFAADDPKAADKIGKPLPEKGEAKAGQGEKSGAGVTTPAGETKAKADADAAAKRKAALTDL